MLRRTFMVRVAPTTALLPGEDLFTLVKKPSAAYICASGVVSRNKLFDPQIVIQGRQLRFPMEEGSSDDLDFLRSCVVHRQPPSGITRNPFVDTNSLQFDPSEFTIGCSRWQQSVTNLVQYEVCPRLGFRDEARSQCEPLLQKLVVYPSGALVERHHRELKKLCDHFATLILQLPCVYQGGDLTFSYNEGSDAVNLHQREGRIAGREVFNEVPTEESKTDSSEGVTSHDDNDDGKYDMYCWPSDTVSHSEASSKNNIFYTCHYNGVDHEMKAITSGVRGALIYNLSWKTRGRKKNYASQKKGRKKTCASIFPSLLSRDRDELIPSAINFLETHCRNNPTTPGRLDLALDHAYTAASFVCEGIHCLKSIDAQIASLLLAASAQLERESPPPPPGSILPPKGFLFLVANFDREEVEIRCLLQKTDFSGQRESLINVFNAESRAQVPHVEVDMHAVHPRDTKTSEEWPHSGLRWRQISEPGPMEMPNWDERIEESSYFRSSALIVVAKSHLTALFGSKGDEFAKTVAALPSLFPSSPAENVSPWVLSVFTSCVDQMLSRSNKQWDTFAVDAFCNTLLEHPEYDSSNARMAKVFAEIEASPTLSMIKLMSRSGGFSVHGENFKRLTKEWLVDWDLFEKLSACEAEIGTQWRDVLLFAILEGTCPVTLHSTEDTQLHQLFRLVRKECRLDIESLNDPTNQHTNGLTLFQEKFQQPLVSFLRKIVDERCTFVQDKDEPAFSMAYYACWSLRRVCDGVIRDYCICRDENQERSRDSTKVVDFKPATPIWLRDFIKKEIFGLYCTAARKCTIPSAKLESSLSPSSSDSLSSNRNLSLREFEAILDQMNKHFRSTGGARGEAFTADFCSKEDAEKMILCVPGTLSTFAHKINEISQKSKSGCSKLYRISVKNAAGAGPYRHSPRQVTRSSLIKFEEDIAALL